MTSFGREPTQKSEDELSFLANYYNHCLAVEEKHRQLFGPIVNVGDFLKASTNIAATKFNFFAQLRDGYDYLDEVMGVIFIPVACLGLSILSILVASLKMVHMIAIVVNIADNPEDASAAQQALEGLILSITFPCIAIASLIKCSISMITRPISTLVQGVQPFDDEDENRFLAEYSSPI